MEWALCGTFIAATACIRFRRSFSLQANTRGSQTTKANLQELLTSRSSLVQASIDESSIEERLQKVCIECDQTLVLQRGLVAGSIEGDIQQQVLAVIRSLESTLHEILSILSRAAAECSFEPADAYWSAVEKIKWRTPYMTDWGDGSSAETAREAMDHWKRRKGMRKGEANGRKRRLAEESNGGCAREQLFFVVDRLTAVAGGCPWTRTQTTADLIQYLKDECRETMAEIELVRIGKGDVEALVSELGDLLFNIFMAISLAARDFDFDPEQIRARAYCHR